MLLVSTSFGLANITCGQPKHLCVHSLIMEWVTWWVRVVGRQQDLTFCGGSGTNCNTAAGTATSVNRFLFFLCLYAVSKTFFKIRVKRGDCLSDNGYC